MSTDQNAIEISDAAALPNAPLVSVYMLAYRHERFISDAIEGVINQQRDFPIELIIGEDCSTDETLKIVLDYQRRYPCLIRVITSGTNVGAHANATRCRAACRGKYIALCEGDDYWHHQGKLKLQVEAMVASPTLTLCHTDFDRRIGNRVRKNMHAVNSTPYLADGEAYEDLLHAWTVMTATTLYRADVVKDFAASQFYNRSWPFADYNLALFAAVKGEIKYLSISTATWRKVAGSASNADADSMLKMRLASLACRETYMEHFPVPESTRRECLAFANHSVMSAAFRANKKDVFLEARANVLKLGGTIPRRIDWIRRISLSLGFPINVYQALRIILVKFTTARM